MRVPGLLIVLVAAAVGACSSGDDTSTGTGSTTSTVVAAPASVAPAAATSAAALPTSTGATAPATTGSPDTTSAPCSLPEDGVHSIMSGELERTYLTRRPATAAGEPVPVVVLFHGFNGSAEEFSATSGVADVAAAGGVLLVAPQGVGSPAGWEIPNWAADADYVNAVLDEVGASGCAATGDVWVGGHSAGSAFAAFYACSNTERVAGAWLNAGLPPPLCTDRSPAIVISHGTEDPVVPFGGGGQNASDQTFVLKPVPESAAEWAATAGCTIAPATEASGSIEATMWTSCSKGSYVRLYRIEGGGHVWPGSAGQTGIGETTNELDAACLLIESARTSTDQPADPATCT